MSSKSSQEAIVAQVTNSKTSWSGYTMRHGSRLSLSSQKQGKTRTRDLSVEDRVHDGAPCESGAPTESRSLRQHKITLIRPLTWIPCRAVRPGRTGCPLEN